MPRAPSKGQLRQWLLDEYGWSDPVGQPIWAAITSGRSRGVCQARIASVGTRYLRIKPVPRLPEAFALDGDNRLAGQNAYGDTAILFPEEEMASQYLETAELIRTLNADHAKLASSAGYERLKAAIAILDGTAPMSSVLALLATIDIQKEG